MSEEEQEAIEELKNFSNLIIEGGIPNSFIVNKLKITFNLIDKLQKELQYEKNEIMNLAGMLDEKDEEIKSLEIDLEIGNNMCGKLQEENEKLKELLGE